MVTYPNVKINLGLNVLRKRPDGFHDLDTVFVPFFDIHDTLEIIAGDDYSRTVASLSARYSAGGAAGSVASQLVQAISRDGKLMITIARREGVDWNPLDDLTAKAYRLLDADYHLPAAKIFLEKTSPVGAGLGGGSADGAFALKMLSDLFSLGLGEDDLASYASRIGSDCAFFVYNRPMRGQGRGEILTEFPLDVLEGYRIEVAVPEGVSVSTADAYRGITPCVPEVDLSGALSCEVSDWRSCVVNDFETTVFKKYPLLSRMKESLYESGAVYASMSGSGSAFYGIYRK